MKGVLLPRYDENQKLLGDLYARTLTLENPEQIYGKDVTIRFFSVEESSTGHIHLESAKFYTENSHVISHEVVELHTERLFITAKGLIYDFVSGKGLFMKEVQTRILAQAKQTSMKLNPVRSVALAAGLATSSLSANPPAAASPEQIAELTKAAVQTKEIEETDLNEMVAVADQASKAADAFMKESGVKTSIESDQSVKEPLQVIYSEDDTVITSDGGMYFDSEEGVLVYMDNVRVRDPRFTLEGANQLKIFLEKKPKAKKKDETKGKEVPSSLGKFGDLRQFIAEGAVVIHQKGIEGKEPIQASGRIVTYDLSKEEVLIHGGYPWVKQGSYYARAKEEDLTLRLLKDGSFSTRGNWEMGGNIKKN